jgi:hypothetical protein
MSPARTAASGASQRLMPSTGNLPHREEDLVRGSDSPMPVSTNATANIGESTMGFLTAVSSDAAMLRLSWVCEVLSRITKVMGDTTMEPRAIATATPT